jgi:hypothetical protein
VPGSRLPDQGHRAIWESAWWIVATTGGYLIGALLVRLVSPVLFPFSPFKLQFLSDHRSLDGLLTGCVVGIMQWLYLHPLVHRAGCWILISVASSLVAHGLALTIWDMVESSFKVSWFEKSTCHRTVSVGLLYGVALGWFLARVKPRPQYGGVSETDCRVIRGGWPIDRDTRLCVSAGLCLFAFGLALFLLPDAALSGPSSLYPIRLPLLQNRILYHGLFLIPLSALVAFRDHTWAVFAATLGMLCSFIHAILLFETYYYFTFTDSYERIFRLLLSWNLSGILMTVGWIDTAQRARRRAM